MTSIRSSSSGKTSRGFSRSRTTRSGVFSARWLERTAPSFLRKGKNGRTLVWLLAPGDRQPGESLTPSISAFPSEGGVYSSLPDVLEDGSIPPRYFLSRKACQGILTRAKKRNKKLPPILAYALEQQAKGYVAVAAPLKAPVLLEAEVTGTIPSRNRSGGGLGTDFEVAGGVQAVAVRKQIAHTLRGEGHDASEDGSGRGRPLVVNAVKAGGRQRIAEAVFSSLRIAHRSSNGMGVGKVAYTPECSNPCAVAYAAKLSDFVLVIRYLTPVECERLQGIPDNYTLIPWRKGLAADGPRYKAIGNGMAVPCVSWIIKRLHRACAARVRTD